MLKGKKDVTPYIHFFGGTHFSLVMIKRYRTR